MLSCCLWIKLAEDLLVLCPYQKLKARSGNDGHLTMIYSIRSAVDVLILFFRPQGCKLIYGIAFYGVLLTLFCIKPFLLSE